jgi:hypothetical protein
MFFEAKDGCSCPASRIVRILPVADNSVTIELIGGFLVEAFPWRIENLMRQPVSTFAAQPGTFIVQKPDDGDEIWKTVVIGWCVGLDGDTYPITADGVNDGLDVCLYVLTPDGMVSQRHGGIQTFDSWVAEQRGLEAA